LHELLRPGHKPGVRSSLLRQQQAGEQILPWVELYAIDMPGEVVEGAILLLLVDRSAELALRESEERLRKTLAELNQAQQLALIGIWTIDVASGKIYWSDQTYRLFGLSEGDPIDLQRFAAFVHEDDREAVLQAWNRAIESGHYDIEHRIRVGAEVRWVRERAHFEMDAQASLQGLGTVQDITQRKQLTLEIEKQRQRLDNIIWGADVGTWEWNMRTDEVLLNQRWAGMLGYRLEELEPISLDTWKRLVEPKDLVQAEAALQRHIQGETEVYEAEMRMRHKAGDWVWVLDRGRIVSRDEQGQPLWFVGTHLDITDRHKVEERVRLSEERLQLIFQGINDGVWDWDLATDELYFSPRWLALLGYLPGELDGNYETFIGLIHPQDQGLVRQAVAEYLGGRRAEYAVEMRMREKQGGWRWILTRGMALRDDAGVAYRFLGSHTDIHQRKQAEAKLQLAASVFAESHEGIMITDLQGLIIDVNQAFSRITGYAAEDVIGQNPALLNSGHQSPAFFAEMWRQLREQGHWSGEVWNRRKSGELFAELLTISAVRDEQGNSSHYVALFSDITAQKQHQSELERLAHFDVLTGLPNRSLFSDRLGQAMANANRRNQRIALAFIDLDGFKAINDNHGHKVGDQLLRELAQRMREVCREGDTVARIGGDEFVALFIDLGDFQASEPMLQRLLQACATPVQLDGQSMAVSASIGVAFYPQPQPIEADQLLRQADQAMYQAKLSGKNRYQLFTPKTISSE
ncbi:MAG: PAS domain-containing protein, partial [Gammaproteobacteria bacterium]|nr:PAS domain-containing protein [Gammaproteobacteria bacterium]